LWFHLTLFPFLTEKMKCISLFPRCDTLEKVLFTKFVFREHKNVILLSHFEVYLSWRRLRTLWNNFSLDKIEDFFKKRRKMAIVEKRGCGIIPASKPGHHSQDLLIRFHPSRKSPFSLCPFDVKKGDFLRMTISTTCPWWIVSISRRDTKTMRN
jgi:hypothetical protein